MKNNKKNDKNINDSVNALSSIFAESINFLFKGSDITNFWSYILVFLIPLIALILSSFMVIYRYFKLIFRK